MPSREYYQDHAEQLRAYGRRYYQEHREERQAYARRYLAEHPEVRTFQRQYNHDYHAKLKAEPIAHYSNGLNKCAYCGFDNILALTIDHMNNNGCEQKRELGFNRGGIRFYRWLQKNNYPDGYQVLCANCNLIKELNRRYLRWSGQAQDQVKETSQVK